MKPEKKKGGKKLPARLEELVESNRSPETDPNGSYTGKPVNRREVPVQDADDL